MDIKRMQMKYQNESPLLSEEEKKEKILEIQRKVNELRRLQQESAKEFNELRAESIKEIRKDVRGYAEKIGEREGYLLVIEKESGTVIYARDPKNITDQVIRYYDQSSNTKK